MIEEYGENADYSFLKQIGRLRWMLLSALKG